MEADDRYQTLAYRLELACAHCGIKESALAKIIGVSHAYLSEVKAQNGKRGHKRLALAAENLGVPAEWLLSGAPPFPEWWPRKIADSARQLVKAGLVPASQPHRPTLTESAAVYAVRGLTWMVEPLYQAGESARGRILRASADPRTLPPVAGSVGYDTDTMAWGAWDTESPDLTFDLRPLFRVLPLGRLRLIDVLDGSGGDRYPQGCRIAVSNDLVVDFTRANAQRGWVAWMADDGASGIAEFHMGPDRLAELRAAGNRINRYPVDQLRVASIYARLDEVAPAPPAPRLAAPLGIHCMACGHRFKLLSEPAGESCSAVVICPACGSSLTNDPEATSGWRVLKSPHDQTRTTPEPH